MREDAMPPEKNVSLRLPADLAAEMEAIAAAEGKTPDELYQDAAERLVSQRRLLELVEYGQAQAKRLGLSEEDVPRLIQESRRNRGSSSASASF
jgi:hypothetical protein